MLSFVYTKRASEYMIQNWQNCTEKQTNPHTVENFETPLTVIDNQVGKKPVRYSWPE